MGNCSLMSDALIRSGPLVNIMPSVWLGSHAELNELFRQSEGENGSLGRSFELESLHDCPETNGLHAGEHHAGTSLIHLRFYWDNVKISVLLMVNNCFVELDSGSVS